MIKPNFCVITERGRLRKYYGSDGSILLHGCIRGESELVEMPKTPPVSNRVKTQWLPELPTATSMEDDLSKYDRWRD